MAKDYRRCHFTSNGRDCDNWFSSEDTGSKTFCFLHIGENPPAIPLPPDKTEYLERINSKELMCAKMNFEELDAHISEMESVIQLAKETMLIARRTKADKMSSLSEEERKAQKSASVTRACITPQDATASRAKPKKAPTLIADPVGYFMAKHPTMTRAQVEKMLADD